MAIRADEDVLWFQVAVNYTSGVQTIDTFNLSKSMKMRLYSRRYETNAYDFGSIEARSISS